MTEGQSHCIQHKTINLTSWQTEPHQSECDLYNSRTVGEANSPAVWSLPVLLATVIKGQNSGIKMVMWKSGDGKQQASAELWYTRHKIQQFVCTAQGHFELPALFTCLVCCVQVYWTHVSSAMATVRMIVCLTIATRWRSSARARPVCTLKHLAGTVLTLVSLNSLCRMDCWLVVRPWTEHMARCAIPVIWGVVYCWVWKAVYVATLHTHTHTQTHRINLQKLSCMHHQQFVDNFREFLVICSPDVKHICDLIWPFTTPSLNAIIFMYGRVTKYPGSHFLKFCCAVILHWA